VHRAYRAGYEFHQSAVRSSPEVLAWVLQPDYWDYRLPLLKYPAETKASVSSSVSILRSLMNILVTGGAGYVGSHACKALAARDYVPCVRRIHPFKTAGMTSWVRQRDPQGWRAANSRARAQPSR
jgi:NAD dependent epimerase/dehydratase family